jgi:hypothetical protein
MVALLAPFALALLAVVAKATRWSERPVTSTSTVGRVANLAIVLAVGWELGLAIYLLGSRPINWPVLTLDQMSKLGPIATALAALVALIVGGITVWQRTNADRRDQWWKRTEWALGWAMGADSAGNKVRVDVGLAALGYQGRSRLAKRDESEFLRACLVDDLDKYRATMAVVAASGTEEDGDVVFVLVDDDPTVVPEPGHEGG